MTTLCRNLSSMCIWMQCEKRVLMPKLVMNQNINSKMYETGLLFQIKLSIMLLLSVDKYLRYKIN